MLSSDKLLYSLESDPSLIPARSHTLFGWPEADYRGVFKGARRDAGGGCEEVG